VANYFGHHRRGSPAPELLRAGISRVG
jgi:hypothetical protein